MCIRDSNTKANAEENKIKGTSVVVINDEKVMPGIKLKVMAENDEAISLLVNILVDRNTNIVAIKYKIGTGNLIQFSVLPHK